MPAISAGQRGVFDLPDPAQRTTLEALGRRLSYHQPPARVVPLEKRGVELLETSTRWPR